MKEQHGWSKTASGTTTATATKAAEAGRQHVIFGFSAGGNINSSQNMLVLIKDGTTTIWQEEVEGTIIPMVQVYFSRGVVITKGAECSIVATKTGATSVRVNLHGITRG